MFTSILLKIWQAILSLKVTVNSSRSAILTALQEIQSEQQKQSDQLAQIISLLTPGPAVGFEFIVTSESGLPLENPNNMQTMQDDQKLTLTAKPKDKKGADAVIDGLVAWASSDETVVTVAPSDDSFSCVVSGVAPGSARVTATGDADLGAGVTPITGVEDFTITGGGAVTFELSAGTPEDQ